MAVTFDAVGPGATGIDSASYPVTWTHPGTASATCALVGVSLDGSGDTAYTLSATYGGTSMTSVLRWESGGSSQSVGFLQVFSLLTPPTGSQTVSVSVAGGTPGSVNGGSFTFAGATALGAAQHSDSNATGVTSGSVVVPTVSASNMVAAFICDGSGGISWTAGTSRFICTGISGAAAGFAAGATAAGTGANVTLSWSQTSDFYAAIGLEVQASGGGGPGSSGPPLFPQNMTSAPATIVTMAGWRNAQHSL